MMDESMSKLTSTSGEFSAASGTATALYPQQSIASTNQAPNAAKKKRNLPGNPDPDAEVIALSPKTLLATNRFLCEICNKGFQRDQNLQLHRRGHNLPWKLKQRTNKEVARKKVYVCPETTCVHHEPSRALGDLTGIKKHFCRKHGEKKWKCEKCSKTYAVQSDWKAHSKICGTREYRCDCGTLFSRRDSFITHRAFCDALAEESARAITTQQMNSLQPQVHSHGFNALSAKEEEGHPFNARAGTEDSMNPTWLELDHRLSENPSQNMSAIVSSPHTSATALLQKAAQMGVTMSQQSPVAMQSRPYFVGSTAGSGLGLFSRDQDLGSGFPHGNKAAAITSGLMEQYSCAPLNSLLNEMLRSLPSATGFEGSSPFEQSFYRTWSTKGNTSNGANKNNDGNGTTRDFLDLKPFPHRDHFPNLAELNHRFNTSSSTYVQQNRHSQTPWQG
ncbi:Protein indeterminate-domain 7 [Hibiscus syriacus]|uniref:Protein indeterminate-domain 7 n=2 Tax=Hibiscus syriacus TaxID=106335 RepID=A0A6A2ZDE8_HIBSY|nr:Protein indeterminate-domain 7 [Hibiscus syriacus]